MALDLLVNNLLLFFAADTNLLVQPLVFAAQKRLPLDSQIPGAKTSTPERDMAPASCTLGVCSWWVDSPPYRSLDRGISNNLCTQKQCVCDRLDDLTESA